jgi:hypothetical protein
MLDRGGLFRDAITVHNGLDPEIVGEAATTITDPRELYSWLQTILFWMTAGCVIYMR